MLEDREPRVGRPVRLMHKGKAYPGLITHVHDPLGVINIVYFDQRSSHLVFTANHVTTAPGDNDTYWEWP